MRVENESEIHSDSILLFHSPDRKDIFPTHTNALLIIGITNNSNIGQSYLEMRGLYLNEYGADKQALTFVKRMRSLFNSGSSKKAIQYSATRWVASFKPVKFLQLNYSQNENCDRFQVNKNHPSEKSNCNKQSIGFKYLRLNYSDISQVI